MFPGPFQLQPIMEVEGMAHGGPVFRNSSFQKVGKWRAVISLFLLFGCFFFFFFKDFETSGGGKEWGETCKSWSPCSLVSWNISTSIIIPRKGAF